MAAAYNGCWTGGRVAARSRTSPDGIRRKHRFTRLRPEMDSTEPARPQVRMGRASSVGEGINWLTLAVLVVFHLGAIAALFFFSWQRLTVMAALYVLAINVASGCAITGC